MIAAAAALFILGEAAAAQAQVIFPYPYPPTYRYAEPLASVRIEVTPKEAEVYVDGYFAGIVDDFDGTFQRLRVEPGAHEITLYHDGFRSLTQQVYLTPDGTFKIKNAMEPLAPGDVAQARPIPPSPPEPPEQMSAPPMPGQRGPRPPFGPPPPNAPRQPNRPPMPNAPPPPNAPSAGNPPQSGGIGTISLRVQPSDSEVLVDGQVWRVPDGQERLVIDAAAGSHSVQIRKAGYVGYLTEIQVRPSETATIDVNLRRLP